MNNILDENFSANNSINSLDDIKKGLQQAGITSFYEHKNGSIIVEESDAVQLEIRYENDEVIIKSKFPQIGNTVQIIVSAILLAVFLFIVALPFPFQWVVAILGGQVFSYAFFTPRTKKLKERIENYLLKFDNK